LGRGMGDQLRLNVGIGKGVCRRCQAKVVWARATTGRVMPFEVAEGGVWAIINGVAHMVGRAAHGMGVEAATRYRSHFEICGYDGRNRDRGSRGVE
jgi:hypothetical protein